MTAWRTKMIRIHLRRSNDHSSSAFVRAEPVTIKLVKNLARTDSHTMGLEEPYKGRNRHASRRRDGLVEEPMSGIEAIAFHSNPIRSLCNL
jgi:hypothetical protein